jgi:hypothetical protein
VNLSHTLPEKYNIKSHLRTGAAVWCKDCKWVYDYKKRQVIDRLVTVQSVISQAFPGPDDGNRLAELLRTAITVHGFIREHWKVFSEGEVDKYFDKVKQISEFVAAATRSYGAQIDALIKSLTTTMLGAVVTVVGTFVGSLLRGDFNPIILIIGLGVYSGYLIIFPGTIGLTNAWQHFSELKQRIRQQFEELKKRVQLADEKKWLSLKDQLAKSERRFRDWFGVTVTAYGLVCFLAIVAIIFLLIF